MLDCPRCGTALDLTARDCRRCGADARPAIPAGVGLVCRACFTFHEPGVAWCVTCGQPLADAAGRESPGAEAAVPAPPAPDAAVLAPPALRVVAVRPDGTTSWTREIGPGPLLCAGEGPAGPGETAGRTPLLRFTPRGDRAIAEDLGSRTGAFVRVREPVSLSSTTEIRIGRQRLRVELHSTQEGGGRGLLVQLWPDGRAKALFPLRGGPNVLGRSHGDVSFPADRSVSARHARLTVAPDGLTLEDLGSSNGTFVRLSAPAAVGAGDQLLLGNELLRIEAIP